MKIASYDIAHACGSKRLVWCLDGRRPARQLMAADHDGDASDDLAQSSGQARLASPLPAARWREVVRHVPIEISPPVSQPAATP